MRTITITDRLTIGALGADLQRHSTRLVRAVSDMPRGETVALSDDGETYINCQLQAIESTVRVLRDRMIDIRRRT